MREVITRALNHSESSFLGVAAIVSVLTLPGVGDAEARRPGDAGDQRRPGVFARREMAVRFTVISSPLRTIGTMTDDGPGPRPHSKVPLIPLIIGGAVLLAGAYPIASAGLGETRAAAATDPTIPSGPLETSRLVSVHGP